MSVISHRIVIIGGGAAGLPLASTLGRKYKKDPQVDITLVDQKLTHIWKPLLHEVAAGTFDSHVNQVSFLSQAKRCHFNFRLGALRDLNRETKTVTLAPTLNDSGEIIVPESTLEYDTLVFCLGSQSNDFNVTGVTEHCKFLDSTHQAERFHQHLLQAILKSSSDDKQQQLNIAIVGAGATGVELSAQLREVTDLLHAYGLAQVDDHNVNISLLEGTDRILPALPEYLSTATHEELEKRGIKVLTNMKVVGITEESIEIADQAAIPCAIKVWAAGVKAPDFLANIAGLETNRANQLQVRQTLQTTLDDNIFAMGDCAACPWPEHDKNVPPRAQAAHQQASLLVKSMKSRIQGDRLPGFVYKDYGSLVSLGGFSTVGSLMGNLLGTVRVEGMIARMVYLSLYKMHQMSLFGVFPTLMLSLSNVFRRTVHPSIKLH